VNAREGIEDLVPQADRAAALIMHVLTMPLDYDTAMRALRAAWLQGYSEATLKALDEITGSRR
jgi:hypothetical protein